MEQPTFVPSKQHTKPGVTPYGVFMNLVHSNEVTFRNAGSDRFICSFLNPLNEQEMIRGTNAVLMQHAFLLAKASKVLGNKN